MPGFHKHQGEESYYLIPNFGGDCRTYQVESEGSDMLQSMGYDDGDSVPRSIFNTINDLGFLYFKESTEDPQSTAPTPDELDYDSAVDFPLEMRCSFIERIISEYSLDTIDSDAFYRLILSVDDGDAEHIFPIIDQLLNRTPFTQDHLPTVSDAIQFRLYTQALPLATAMYINLVYEGLRANPESALEELSEYNEELVQVTGEWGIHLTDRTAWAPEPDDEWPKVEPVPLKEALEGSAKEVLNTIHNISKLLGKELLQHSDSHIAKTVAAGLNDMDGTTIVFVPIAERDSKIERSE